MYTRILAATLLALVCPFGSTLAQKAEDRGAQPSRFAAETEYKQIAEENVKLSAEIGQINVFMPQIESAQRCISQAKLEPKAGATVADLKAAFDEVKRLPGSTLLNARNAPWQRLNRNIDVLYSVTGNSLYECARPVIPQPRNPGQTSAEPVIDVIRDAATAPLRIDRSFDFFLGRVNTLLDFSRVGSPDQSKRRSDLRKEEIDRIDGELAALTSDGLNRIFEEQRALHAKAVEQIAARGRSELDARNAKLKTNQARLTELDKILGDKQAAQTALDRGLLWAVYGMILSLTILFLSLRIFKVELATQVVKDRSLVEMVSMAFILLTIIILGTGEKIGKETIGTLLGTIAGYIFARKIAEEGKDKSLPPGGGGPAADPARGGKAP